MDYKKISSYILLAMMLVGVAVAGIFFGLGDEAEGYEVAGDILAVPRATVLFMGWNYILFAASILVTLGFVIAGFCSTLRADKKAAMAQLGIVVAFVVLFAVCWLLGSGEKINIIGYDGTDNQGFWANLADMMMYVCYVLVLGTLGALVWGVCYTKLKK